MPDDPGIGEVYTRVGRNVLHFQKLEYMLKFLVSNSSVSGYASEIQDKMQKQAALTHKLTMGQLIGRFIDATTSDTDSFELEEPLVEVHISMNHRFESDGHSVEERKRALASLVAERNYLAHHLLADLDATSEESCSRLCKRLDEQYALIQGEIETFRARVTGLKNARVLIVDAFKSGLLNNLFKQADLKEEPLTLLLMDICTENARSDGWVPMSKAGQLIKQKQPRSLEAVKRAYNHKTLKAVLLATELFDISEEQTKKGGKRTLIRLKDQQRSVSTKMTARTITQVSGLEEKDRSL